MKKKTVMIPVAVAAGLALSLTGNRAEASPGTDLIRLSHQLEDIAGELTHEFRLHYKHTGAYRHLVSDANKIVGEAEHIHRLAHDPYASLQHLRTDVRQLDDLAHHLHELVDATERGRYGGHAHGDTRHVHTELAALNRTIHKMEAVIASMAEPCHINRHHSSNRHSSNRHNDRHDGLRIIGGLFNAISGRHGH